jgi:tRNA pseudouridine55 synthase
MINFTDGYILPVDKPYAWTSADVVRKIKNLLKYKSGIRKIKVGHAGTLDPLATGLLIVCIGKATKKVEEIQNGDKEYIADIHFGATTPSYDLEKEPDAVFPYEHITEDSLRTLFPQFIGETEQKPPVFSAKSIAGKRAYDYARKGDTPEIAPVKIKIYELELLDYTAPTAKLRIRCSKGTYIRSLANDLGKAAGSGAYLSALRRTASGEYRVEKALTIQETESFFDLNKPDS